jgi:hypothetical protein
VACGVTYSGLAACYNKPGCHTETMLEFQSLCVPFSVCAVMSVTEQAEQSDCTGEHIMFRSCARALLLFWKLLAHCMHYNHILYIMVASCVATARSCSVTFGYALTYYDRNKQDAGQVV